MLDSPTFGLTVNVGSSYVLRMDIRAIVRAGGGPLKLGKALGLKHSSVCCWTRVPAPHVRSVSKLTGIALHDLRPDLYDPPPAANAVQEHAA